MSELSPVSRVFADLKQKNQLAFIPFVTAGDPDLATTQDLIRTVARGGADLIEVGFPYSDPIADGPIIQSSYTRALNQKLTVQQIFAAVEHLKTETLPPLVAMVSYAIIFRHGTAAFLAEAKQAGFSGFIVPDLPADEAADLAPLMQEARLDLIPLIAPTTTRQRAELIMAHATGFIYCIAVAGITGTREKMAEGLIDQLQWLKTQTEVPLAVGFGISKPEHLLPLKANANGAIVGSAIVQYLQQLAEGKLSREQALSQIEQFVQQMAETAHQSA